MRTARSTRTDGDRTRRRLIDVAIAAFAADGFSAVSTRRLAGDADCNVATLNYHFGSKLGLYRAAVEAVYERIAARAADVVPTLPGAAIGDIVERAWRIAREERDGIRILLRQVLDEGRLEAESAAAHFLPSLEERAALAGHLLGVSPTHARTALVTLGLLLGRAAVQDAESLREAYGAASVDAAERTVIHCLTLTAHALLEAPCDTP